MNLKQKRYRVPHLEIASVVESDEGAARFQQELERRIERERKRQWQPPPRTVERVRGIRI